MIYYLIHHIRLKYAKETWYFQSAYCCFKKKTFSRLLTVFDSTLGQVLQNVGPQEFMGWWWETEDAKLGPDLTIVNTLWHLYAAQPIYRQGPHTGKVPNLVSVARIVMPLCRREALALVWHILQVSQLLRGEGGPVRSQLVYCLCLSLYISHLLVHW